ncbi:MAG TPA: hypothetical protein VJ976_10565 [Ornithinimicrobium sp.]|uniref:hypothetical protein n=1 Tax=Ornithinimicrobium sp. TaxID=1977084 RepID=UPI002B486726|nr:hypothetical protein [Ornithinimicrobium sp.]HKJ12814.1 hypothetical protein [Ornithinimicrobium sp.]
MSRRPSTDFADFVSARGSALHRTAVVLTHDEQAARELVLVALVRAGRGRRRQWATFESDVRGLLVRDYVRRSSGGRRKEDAEGSRKLARPPTWARTDEEPASVATDPPLGDPLAGLSGRGRAWCVLRSLHGHSAAGAASVLRMGRRAGAREEARTLDSLGVESMSQLEPVLGAVADSFPPPDASALNAVLRSRAIAYGRQRAMRAAVGAIGVLALTAGVVTWSAETDDRSERVRAARTDPAYAAGYGLVDGRPRPYVDGLALEKVEVIDYALRSKRVSAPQVEDGGRLYAVAYCDLPGNALDVDAVVDAITVTPHDLTGEPVETVPEQAGSEPADPDAPGPVALSCVDRSADTPTAPVISPLPGDVDDFTVTVPSVWSGTGAVHLAFYTEVPWSSYPFSAVPSAAAPPPEPGTGSVVDPSTRLGATGQVPDWLEEEQKARVRSMEVDIDTTLELTLRTSEPGQLLVALDGVVVTNDGEELTALGRSRPGPWRQADPALRQGFWRGYSASGYTRHFDFATLSRLGVDITDDSVTVSVVDRGFNGEGWQVIATTDGGEEAMPLAAGYADSLPEYAHGLRRVATYQVPTDGEPHRVPLSARDAAEVTWIGACGIETPREVRALTLTTPSGSGLVPCAAYRSEWASPLMPLRAPSEAVPQQASPSDPRRPTTLTAPSTPERTSLTVGAYVPVPYEDFPFETEGQPSTSPLNLRPVPDEGEVVGRGWASSSLSAWTEVDALSRSGLDRRGQGQLSVTTDRPTLVSVSTRGRGRFMIRVAGGDPPVLDGMFWDPWVLGRVASPLMHRDGWWTSWTTEPTDWAIPLRTDAGGSTARLEVTAQGYDPGSLEITVLEAADAAPSQ